MQTDVHPAPPSVVPAARSHRSAMTAISVMIVWLAVGAVSVLSPDLVTGSAQEHLPLAAITGWWWGVVATALILMAAGLARDAVDGRWRVLAVSTGTIWAIVALTSIMAPEMVTGADPTRIPIAALLTPVAGTIVTAFVCLYVAGAPRR